MAVRHRIFAIILAFISISLILPAVSAQTAKPTPDASVTVAPGPAAPASKARPKPEPKAARPKKPALTRTIEAQLSGFTSPDADNLYARLSLQEKKDSREWYIRGSISRTATKYGNADTRVGTTKFDSRLERMQTERGYDVWTGVMSRREREPASRRYPRRSGYSFLSYGAGRRLDANTRGDIGLGVLDIYDEGDGTKPAALCSIRGRRPLSEKLSLDGDILLLQPVDRLRSTKVDSDLGLSYGVAPGLSLRLGWSATNLIRPVRTSREWDSVLRLSISYRRTTTR